MRADTGAGRAGRAPRGRPRIQETADAAVARLLAGAGEAVDGPSWSTRSLSDRTGLSQTVVARAVRRLADGGGGTGDADTAGGGMAGGGTDDCDAGGGGTGDAGTGGGERRTARRLVLTAVEVDGHTCRTTFAVAPPGVRTSGPRVHRRRRAAFRAAVRELGVAEPPGLGEDLAAAVAVPRAVLAALAAAVGSGDAGRWVSWAERPATAPDPPWSSDSSQDLGAWLPRAGVSVTEMLAVRLRDAITASDLRPGDALTAAHAARLLDVPRSVAADVLRRMVDDELLDGSRGDVRIPLASANDVIELYAARMLLGDVLLRAASARPRRHLLRARRVLDAIAEGAAAGTNVGDADLRFQQEVARASGLEQTVRLFESSTVRVRMLIAVLRMDYARAAGSILADDRRILAALVAGDADTAVRAWHRKTDAAVRHMHGRARHAAFDVALWRLLTAL